MSTNNSVGVALVMSGPSGAGKSTVCKRMMQDNPKLKFSISCTTRQPREGEVHGTHYFFMTHEEFQQKIAADELIEYAEVHGNYYGTLKSEVINQVQAGFDVLIDIDVQGMRLIKAAAEKDELLKKSCVYIFMSPPNFTELEKRLRGRGTDDDEVISRRLINARKEYDAWQEYEFLVINDEVDVAAKQVASICESFALRINQVQVAEGWPYV